MKHTIKTIHFVGIGGVGMSGIAQILATEGYRIQGSDSAASSTTALLEIAGIKVFIGHAAAHIAGADCVVISSAIKESNPELVAARATRIPVVPRAVMLAELMRLKRGIAVAGTHGKTSTTSLAASVLAEAGLDPTYVIGGQLLSSAQNAQLGKGEFIVVEADESDASFLYLNPMMAIVTNIDADHMETYDHSLDKLKTAFVDFLHRMPFYGAAILCIDDANVRSLLPRVARPIISYGMSEDADVRASKVRAVGAQMHFTAHRKGGADLDIILNSAGQHNVLNALSVIALAMEMELPDSAVQTALANFKGVGRRFQRYGTLHNAQGESFEVIDDYGHHPAELAATIAAAKAAFPNRRLVFAFQPHRYTRTRDCFEDFVQVLSSTDALFLTEVYAASEAPIAAADGRSLARAVRTVGKVEPVFVPQVTDLAAHIFSASKADDVVLVMGAGSVGQVCKQLSALAVEVKHG